ncbi:MAG: ATP-binding protein [bacterium]|nr:ATP-binding protein [bacterium]
MQKSKDYFYIFLGGSFGFLLGLFFLHLVHDLRDKELSHPSDGLITFYSTTISQKIEFFGILLAFPLLGALCGLIKILYQRIREDKERAGFLEKTSQTKSEFISLASHQLRSPLTRIKWSLIMMAKGEFGTLNAEQQEITSKNLESSEQAISLIRELLDISRIEQHRFEFTPKFFLVSEIEKMIKKITADLEQTANDKHIPLLITQPFLSADRVIVDFKKINQICQNLLENAIRYTPKGGNIEVRMETRENNLLVHINDSGIGIPQKDQERIFTKFFRARNARLASEEGTGLGLYLCREWVRIQGGGISFISQEGKGSTFTVSLPLKGRGTGEGFLKAL